MNRVLSMEEIADEVARQKQTFKWGDMLYWYICEAQKDYIIAQGESLQSLGRKLDFNIRFNNDGENRFVVVRPKAL